GRVEQRGGAGGDLLFADVVRPALEILLRRDDDRRQLLHAVHHDVERHRVTLDVKESIGAFVADLSHDDLVLRLGVRRRNHDGEPAAVIRDAGDAGIVESDHDGDVGAGDDAYFVADTNGDLQ